MELRAEAADVDATAKNLRALGIEPADLKLKPGPVTGSSPRFARPKAWFSSDGDAPLRVDGISVEVHEGLGRRSTSATVYDMSVVRCHASAARIFVVISYRSDPTRSDAFGLRSYRYPSVAWTARGLHALSHRVDSIGLVRAAA